MLTLKILIERFRSLQPLFSERMKDENREEWLHDPLSHPALRNMTPDQLADLPFDRGIATQGEGAVLPLIGPTHEGQHGSKGQV
ncbi:MAG TPA: hypothetical protein VEZ24_17285 [Microvirga sp.]|nr:hypothetical protein [Microvirga sp.]